MLPAILPLVGVPAVPNPFPRPPTLYPRDPVTGSTVWHPISRADHTRQRLKIWRAQVQADAAQFFALHTEETQTKEDGTFPAVHARRQALLRQEQAAKALRWESSDPFVQWDAPPLLPSSIFYRPPPPACVAALTGIPVSAWRYGSVSMIHPVRFDPLNGRRMPLFAGEVKNGKAMRMLRRFDPVAVAERTARFDEVRFQRAVAVAEGRDGWRDGSWRCLRCRVERVPCSLERRRNWETERCVGCRRNGCGYCLHMADKQTGFARDDADGTRYRYVSVKRRRGRTGVNVVVYVRTADEVDVDDVRRYAEELVDGRPTSLWGVTLDANDRGAMVLPSWTEAYDMTVDLKERLDKDFVTRFRGYEEIQDKIEREAATWQDYFDLLHLKWTFAHPHMQREPQRRRILADPSKEEFIRKWYWHLVRNPDTPRRPRREWIEALLWPVIAREHEVALLAEARRCK